MLSSFLPLRMADVQNISLVMDGMGRERKNWKRVTAGSGSREVGVFKIEGD